MTASGPFAMGPSMTGNAGRRIAPRSKLTPAIQTTPGLSSTALGSGLSCSAAPSLRTSGGEDNVLGNGAKDEDVEVYSDPDEGVEIIDMESVRHMDWMAPDIPLKSDGKKKKSRIKNENNDEAIDLKGKGKGVTVFFISCQEGSPFIASEAPGAVDSVNALDLSDDEVEEIEDITEDFITQPGLYEVLRHLREEISC
jgi:DNA-directed RNA polymerase III subunit RPC4